MGASREHRVPRVKLFPELGVAAPELGWVPSPGFALRRAAILDRLESMDPGRVLEVGCGSGALLVDLANLGYRGVGVEPSRPAREVAVRLLAAFPAIEVREVLPGAEERFDWLLSFEVLEHIEDDREALREWTKRLRPGGRCLLSVPAHRNRWNVTDVLAGHYRRYDRSDVEDLMAGSGLVVDRIETYGWPASWMIERVRHLVRATQLRVRGVDPASLAPGDPDLTAASGIERSVEVRLFPVYGSWLGRRLLAGAATLQRRFHDKDWGISYLIAAHR